MLLRTAGRTTTETRALHTDLYQLTMAAGYFAAMPDATATFELFVRRLPDTRGYLLAAGLEPALDYLDGLRFTGEQIDYLRGLEPFGRVPQGFFDYLDGLRFEGSVWAMPEGTPFFAGEPILRVTAPIIQAQLAETYLLSLINFQCLVAAKAARIVQAAAGRPVADFGTRRAHGPEAGVLAARAAYIGGCAATSNVEAGHRFGIPVTGTMAHSFVMAFESEAEAFRTYLSVFPAHTTLLLDTYDTLEAARLAAAFGDRIAGVRLDSGDLVALSRQVRRILEREGMSRTQIVASGDLNETKIARLVADGAEIDLLGVGTELVTSRDEPTLSGVYKMVEIERGGRLVGRVKLSTDKESLPGKKQVFRYDTGDGAPFDVVATADETPEEGGASLLVPVVEDGTATYDPPPLAEVRDRAARQVAALPEAACRLDRPEPRPVRLSRRLAAAAEVARGEARDGRSTKEKTQ